MTCAMPESDASDAARWLERAAAGDADGWRELLAQHRDRLRRMVALRLDPRLQGRIDPSDVLQEAYLDAAGHLAGVPAQTRRCRSSCGCGCSPAAGCWSCTATTSARQMRDAGREVSLVPRRAAGGVVRGAGRPAARAASQPAERGRRPRRAEAPPARRRSTSMDPLDREVLALRHFEQLTNAETAQVLGITEAAAGKRYLRALERLQDDPGAAMPGGLEEFLPMTPARTSEPDRLERLAEEFVEPLPPRRAAAR